MGLWTGTRNEMKMVEWGWVGMERVKGEGDGK